MLLVIVEKTTFLFGMRSGSVRGRRKLVRRAVVVTSAAWLLSGCGYSQIQELDEAAREARSDIEVQLQRLTELVPGLIETVERYAAGEAEVIAELADARAGLVAAVRSGELEAMEAQSVALGGAVERLLSGARRSTDLESDAEFDLLRTQLEGTQAELVRAGESYNAAVDSYNAYIGKFPQMVTAKMIGAEKLEPFRPWAGPGSYSTGER